MVYVLYCSEGVAQVASERAVVMVDRALWWPLPGALHYSVIHSPLAVLDDDEGGDDAAVICDEDQREI